MTAKLLKSDGTSTNVSPANGVSFKLHECYELIDCEYVEVVYLDGENILIVDEEGLMNPEFIINQEATIYARIAGTATTIAGNAILCPHEMFK